MQFFEDLVEKAKQKEKEVAEAKKRAQDKFSDLLRYEESRRRLDVETSWDSFVKDYDSDPEFTAVRFSSCFHTSTYSHLFLYSNRFEIIISIYINYGPLV